MTLGGGWGPAQGISALLLMILAAHHRTLAFSGLGRRLQNDRNATQLCRRSAAGSSAESAGQRFLICGTAVLLRMYNHALMSTSLIAANLAVPNDVCMISKLAGRIPIDKWSSSCFQLVQSVTYIGGARANPVRTNPVLFVVPRRSVAEVLLSQVDGRR